MLIMNLKLLSTPNYPIYLSFIVQLISTSPGSCLLLNKMMLSVQCTLLEHYSGIKAVFVCVWMALEQLLGRNHYTNLTILIMESNQEQY